ncbi:Zn(II)2Cys6 transcription factor domain-containing protein [Aspergillus fischeri NRRL 181]|uniref:C6 zinc finger domain protein n=1 Tax=Neosartorya fischeri (strain ATCC 1020 / DSM 3700 / CBS 544.65 / FGSC A1164 / JCM 1740 / NRRL 181 / WB 181) TaxID=331117 RepID=A1DI92_NEOFI|nr:C6 zinc finger domain protein [Aspergillus fischeri NRRL 181]EAW19099.1 C6 zinc finger domain protein [Aspergillus fischeri NRRL 181]
MNWLEQEDTYFPEQYLHSRSCLSFVGMNRDKQSKPSPDRLPKSVKVRSTCNACQQAKIRCSHEKPSCRRCLKHNIECIYSMSRRLGRPAKRRESQYAGLPPDTQRVDARRHERDKKAPISKKKAKEGQANNKKDDEDDFPQRLGETVAYNTIAVDQTMLDDISLDDTNLINDAVDFSSDSWLQEFLSQQGPELAQESDLFDALALENPKNDMPMAVSKQGYNDSESSLKSFPTSSPVGEDHPPTVSLYFADDPMPTEAVTSSAQCPATIQDSYSEFLRRGASVKPQQFSIAEALSGKSWTATEQANLRAHSRAWKRANDVDSPKNNLSPSLAPVSTATGRQCQCQCPEQIVRELIRINICTSRPGPSPTIDSILGSQRVVQHLAETILQCALCSKTRVNLLMVVVVSIDSLITTLEDLISGDARLIEGALPELHDHMHLQPDFGQEIASDGSNRRHAGEMSLRASSAVRKADWTIGHHPPHQVLYAADADNICFAWKAEHDDGDGSEITAVYDEDEAVHQVTMIVGSVAIYLSIEADIVA